MGCDIHMFIEVTHDDGLFWRIDEVHEFGPAHVPEEEKLVNDLYAGRNYELFGLMAGVRGIRTLYEPRGLPHDVSLPVRLKYDSLKDWTHSHSFLSPSEFINCLANLYRPEWSPHDEPQPHQVYGINISSDEHSSFNEIAVRMRYLEKQYPNELVRLVFWFDS